MTSLEDKTIKYKTIKIEDTDSFIENQEIPKTLQFYYYMVSQVQVSCLEN